MTATAYPLTWPPTFPRRTSRERGAFKTTLAGALDNVEGSLRRFAADSGKRIENLVISSNVTLGKNRPADPGVAIWFVWDGLSVCIAVDRYQTVEANLQAIHHIIEARRVELRHGTLALVRLAFYTGLRWVTELLPRQPEDVLKQGADWWLIVPTTKNKQPRMVWLHPGCRADLKWLPFCLHWRTYYARFEAAREAIGRPELVLHDLRHSFASFLISQGATLAEVGAALGHKSHQSTARYAHLYPQAVARTVRTLPTLSRRKVRKTA